MSRVGASRQGLGMYPLQIQGREGLLYNDVVVLDPLEREFSLTLARFSNHFKTK